MLAISELTPMRFDIGLIHLGSEASMHGWDLITNNTNQITNNNNGGLRA